MKQSNMFLSALLLLLYFTTNTVYAGIDPSVASHRPSFQSSTVNGQGAGKCNDDNFSNFCQTEDDKFNWWCVKLDSVLDFHVIWLNNRVTMYGEYVHRIKGFEIRLLGEKGECNKAAAEEARVCYKDTSTRGNNDYLIRNCNQGGLFQGRYVFVVLRNEILNFNELKVYGFPNLLAGRPVAVSSTSGTGSASNGYDSNIDTNVVTNSGSLEWWCVQLDGIYDFKNFQLYNTVDRSSDIQGFEIRLSYDGACDEATARRAGVCYKDNSAPKAHYISTRCNRPVFFAARYVFLVQQNKRLRFSEMQIHGLQSLARNKPTGSSSVLPGGFESWKVTDGSLDTLSRTNVSQVEWICVDLEDVYDLKDLRVYNAIDNTKSRLQGYRTWFLLDGGCSSEGFKRSLLCDYDVSPPQDQYIRHMCQWNTSAIFAARSIYVVVQTNKGVNLREIQAFGSVPANRALGQPALMSSTEGNFPGRQANDGSYSTMSKTKPGSNQWWCVTLKTIYNFTDIKIHNRGDCCKEKMKNFEIRILERGGCSQESLSRAKTCYKEPGTVKDVYHISSCNNGGSFAGQAVFIVNTNSQQLAIRHVEIYGPAFYEVVEVAKRKPAFASGYTVGKGPGNGNDGNIKTFVQTNSGNSEWWCVDLFNQHELFRLKIMNGDTQGRRKLSGFEVKLHPYWGCDRITYQKSTLCYTHRSAASNEYLIHECDDVKTRFFARSVFIRSTQSYFIEFAEIRILANATHPMYNTALNRPSASSSVANGGVAPRGNDGNQNTQLQTNQEDPAWWCVKLPNVYDFMKLAFYPADSSPDTGIEVKLSNFLGCSAEGLNKANRCHIGTMKGGQVHFVFACNLGGQIRGRYVYVKTVSSGSIQLKEFQALGAIRYPLPNVALNKGTLQSSTDGLTSSLAVDGNPATCSRTLVEDEPWFCVDLDKEYVLDSVGVWRSDLGDYEMRLDQTDFCHHKGFESAKPCYRGSDDVVGKCNQVNSGPFSARSVYITFQKRSLHVCDLIVRPENPPVNVQSIASSSTSGSLVASNGFDKNINTNFATNSGPLEWWCVELDRIYDIRTFQLYNTVDKSPDITGFELRLALDGACNTETAKRAPTCFNDRDATLYSYFTFVCNKDVVYTARYVFVVQQNKRLRFSEFKIHGRVGSNRVLGEPAQMSSVEGSYSAGYANDGRYSTMSKTKPGSNQWWCVTMKTIYNFTDIKIHNRRDCCKEKMKNFEMRILERGGCSQESLSRAKTCYKEPGTVKDVYHISSCNNGGSFAGQAVFIVNTNSQQLAIRHVEIYGPVFYEVEEVARRKPAFASGYTVGKGPGNGNDGNIKTFVQTNSGNSEWWCVDLFNQHELFRLKIMNGDTQGRRLSGFEVKLHPYWGCDRITYQKSTLCYTHRSAASNEYLIHECDDVQTRFFARSVFIRSTQSYFIEFAEIRILASATHPMYNTALNRPSASSSVANGGVAPRGNDGNQNTQLQTNQEDPAWWCVKLPNVYDFMKLAFYPADSSPDTGIEVKLSNFLGCSAEGLNKANRCHIGTMKGGQVHFVFACNLGGQIRGRYVYVKTVSSGSIQLKEFQALGAIRYPLPNVALNKGTLQSSTDGLTSSLAVDGNPATCSRTLVEDEPWFCVDLDKEYVLDSVGVWRSDLGDYEMRLDQTDFCHHKGFESAKPCYRGSDDVVGKCNQVNSGPFSARSVYITFQKRSLHVCDLIVRPVTGKGSGCTLDWEGLY